VPTLARAQRRTDSPTTENQKKEEVNQVTEQSREDYRKLTRDELEELAGEPLPERAAMSLVNANVAIPINAAIAANVLSDNAIAYADATQQTPIDQDAGSSGG
jgi:hypothetical protein